MDDLSPRSAEALLQIQCISKSYGGLIAVKELNMEVYQGEILALIGPNGAGKTTTFNLITGFCHPSIGEILFKGEEITHLPPHDIARKGVVRSFQANVLFMDKTVRENVLMGFHAKHQSNIFQELVNTKTYRQDKKRIESKAEEIMEFLHLASFRDQLAKNLSHGHQRILGVAVALAAGPELLLLDEPVAGLNDEETAATMKMVKQIQEQGITILLVEHDMKAVMENCQRIVVMEFGSKICEGSPAEITCNEQVIKAYLGDGEFNM